MTIRANEVALPAIFNADTLTIARSSFGTVGLGDGVGGTLNLNATELAGLSAGTLIVGNIDQADQQYRYAVCR